MREMKLTQGKVARVDDADYLALRRWKWTYLPNKRSGYAIRWETVNGKRRTVYMHRQIMGAQRGQQVDHRDGDGLNNQRDNLRTSTVSQNGANKAVPVREIPYRGVYRNNPPNHCAPYFAQIKAFRKSWRLGSYADQETAARTYDRAALYFFGSFARLNFPDDVESTLVRPLPSVIARLEQQLELPLDEDFPAPPSLKLDWHELNHERTQRAAAVGAPPRGDWDEGLL